MGVTAVEVKNQNVSSINVPPEGYKFIGASGKRIVAQAKESSLNVYLSYPTL